jgi:hypothetical protein
MEKNITQTINKGSNLTCYKRTENIISVIFTDIEMQLLNKALKYNSHQKQKQWIQTLVIEADTAICQISGKDQGYMRQLVANNIKKDCL